MKEKVSTQGQPLFQIGAGAAGTAGIMGLSAGEENQRPPVQIPEPFAKGGKVTKNESDSRKLLNSLDASREPAYDDPQETSYPTVRELIEHIGANREMLETLAKQARFDRTKFTEKDRQATLLLLSANQTPDPERYLSSLSPFFDSQINFDLNRTGKKGYVSLKTPSVATINSLDTPEDTVVHELTHTLQLGPKGVDTKAFPVSYIVDAGKEVRSKVFPHANSEANARERLANLSSYALLEATKGNDFVNSPEGRALMPDKKSQELFFQNTLPGVSSVYGFRENLGKEPPVKNNYDPNESYARRLLNALGVTSQADESYSRKLVDTIGKMNQNQGEQ